MVRLRLRQRMNGAPEPLEGVGINLDIWFQLGLFRKF